MGNVMEENKCNVQHPTLNFQFSSEEGTHGSAVGFRLYPLSFKVGR
jgi:hypothetical protein